MTVRPTTKALELQFRHNKGNRQTTRWFVDLKQDTNSRGRYTCRRESLARHRKSVNHTVIIIVFISIIGRNFNEITIAKWVI